jgi:hypothetical protein
MRPEMDKPGKGKGLLVAIGLGGPKKSMKDDHADEEEPEGEDRESEPDDMEEGGGDEGVQMALDDVADAMDLDGDKREELKDSLKRVIEAIIESKSKTHEEE